MSRNRFLVALITFLAAAGAACAACVLAPAAGAATRCHPHGLVLARHRGIVLWSVRRRSRTRLYLCASSRGRAELVASGGGSLYPGVSRLSVAGNYAAFVLTTALSEYENLVVWDFMRGRRALRQYLGCFGAYACVFAHGDELTQYALAPNGWVAEVWQLSPAYTEPLSPYVNNDRTMLATDDGMNLYSIDFGSSFSLVATTGETLTWTSDLGGASSAILGPGLVPAASPKPLLPCQLLTADDVTAVLGSSTSSTSAGRCTYTSSSNPAMTLSVTYSGGLLPAEGSVPEAALQSAGWDGKMSDAGGFQGYQKATTIDGVAHQQLHAFSGGVELSLDLSAPGPNAGEQLGWLSNVAFDRLFAIPVNRTA